jgi:hypothetical protein
VIFAKGGFQTGHVPERITHCQEIEGIIRQRQLLGATQHKAGAQFSTRDRQHAFTGIQAGDVFRRAENFRRFHGY